MRYLKNIAILATSTLAIALTVSASAQDKPADKAEPKAEAAAPACAGLPPGKHALLEKMTAAFDLTCDQQLKVEPLLHAEEHVSKPLLAFAAFTTEERSAMMLTIKIAARKQIKPLLTPEQQKKMDDDIDNVSKGSDKKGGGKGGAKKPAKVVDPFDAEEALCQALFEYSALVPEQKKDMILQVKKAARREGAPELTADQQKKIDADIQQMTAASAKAK